jgi:integration host factor subunit beta
MQLRRAKLAVALTVSLAGCATPHVSAPPDLLVRGRLENLDAEMSADPDDLLGHGWITGRIYVSRVLRGHVGARVLPVRYFAHTSYAARYGVFRLIPDPNGGYLICGPRGGTGVRCP